ncbi:hypothetical protein [Novosphingobium sp. BL-52-GroH]|uniref:hypothetical protein n=1 Tax=Novosphingobium sp. BL-52-GroH TaxID=3349877 RepID=UPI00384DAD44
MLRLPLLGDWNYEIDDQFYALVGHRLGQGARLYVDIWDRKGPSLYYLYALFDGIGLGPVGYQLAGALATALGAWAIARLAMVCGGGRGAVPAGLAYLVLLQQFGGANGQAQVFYEPLVIACAWSLAARLPLVREGRLDRALLAGFFCAGLAISVKQSAAIEGLFFGLAYCALALGHGAPALRVARHALVLALVGALPLAAWAVWFRMGDGATAFAQALVGSNLARSYMSGGEHAQRLGIAGLELALPVGFAVLGLVSLRRDGARAETLFVGLWAMAATAAVLAYPNLFNHYLLTLLPPLCVLASGLYRRGALGLIALAGLAASILPHATSLDWPTRERAREAEAALARYVAQQADGGRLLVWGQASYLYVLADQAPPSALAFAPHLYDATEAHATGFDQDREISRVLALRPAIVVRQEPLPISVVDDALTGRVDRYLRGCARVRRFTLYDQAGPQVHAVFSGCGKPATKGV